MADNRLVENEYFAKIAQDYRSHTEWIEEGERRLQGLKGQNNSSSALPSDWWLQTPAREGQGAVGLVPMHEKGRWGERMRAILKLWMPLQGSVVGPRCEFSRASEDAGPSARIPLQGP